MAELLLFSAGAAQGLVSALTARFFAETGIEVRATFQPVGVLREKLVAGEACDLLVSTHVMLEELALEGRIVADTVAMLGRVRTGIAVRSRDRAPAIDTREALRASLVAAPAIYIPDPARATAGIHFLKVLRALALDQELAPRLHTHPNGAAAMAALARSDQEGAMGCTQITEIRITSGVQLVGPLKGTFELATAYAVGLSAVARDREHARRFAEMLAGRESAALRLRSGFES
jgi:molybdate transport system substrate-binding protein